jgi:flagellar biosynthesis protein
MTPHKPAPQRAVALAYGAGDNAPKIAAKGYGPIADEIIRRAQEAGVYVHESRELVQLLMQVDLDAHIPPALYQVIAVLLAWIYRVEQNLEGLHSQPTELTSLLNLQEQT